MLICMLGCSITAAKDVEQTAKGELENPATLLTRTKDSYCRQGPEK